MTRPIFSPVWTVAVVTISKRSVTRNVDRYKNKITLLTSWGNVWERPFEISRFWDDFFISQNLWAHIHILSAVYFRHSQNCYSSLSIASTWLIVFCFSSTGHERQSVELPQELVDPSILRMLTDDSTTDSVKESWPRRLQSKLKPRNTLLPRPKLCLPS